MSSIWRSTERLPQFPKLSRNMKTDVLIVGGGLAGILLAYFLQQSGADYVLLEKDSIMSGTSGNTTAKITYSHGLIYDKLLKSGGEEKARAYLNANKDAFSEYEELCRNIECDYEIKDNYVYSLDNPKKIEKELKALQKIGYNAGFEKNLNIPVKAAGSVVFPGQAQFNPIKFAAAVAKDLNIYEKSFVSDIRDSCAVTDCGRVEAKRIVIASHFPFIDRHGSYFLKLYQHRSYVIALENAPDVGGMYVDENDKGLTFRNYKRYLILGGGAHRTGKSGGGWAEIREFAHKNYPQSSEVCHWAAQDCMSLDSVPYIGRYSLTAGELYVSTGFNKWGMTGTMLAARILSEMLLGVKGRYYDYRQYFSPSRSILKPQLLVNAFESAAGLLCPSAKRCTHLGCALKWNPNEHSWDCPCHGSRFTKTGRILENPANKVLKTKAEPHN